MLAFPPSAAEFLFTAPLVSQVKQTCSPSKIHSMNLSQKIIITACHYQLYKKSPLPQTTFCTFMFRLLMVDGDLHPSSLKLQPRVILGWPLLYLKILTDIHVYHLSGIKMCSYFKKLYICMYIYYYRMF